MTESIAPAAPGRAWLTAPSLRPVAIFVASRAVALATAFACGELLRSLGVDPAGYGLAWPVLALPRSNGLRALARWDSAWYLWIAEHGYPHASAPKPRFQDAFFPGYPVLIRLLHSLTSGEYLYCALAIGFVASMSGAIFVWWLAHDLIDAATADAMTTLVCFFPGAFVLSMAYSETVFLAAAAGGVLALTKRRWVLAGLAGAIATATRPPGIALLLAAACAAVIAIRERGEWRALAAPLLAPLGILAYFGYLWHLTGSPFAWFDSQRYAWHERFDFGANALWRATRVAPLTLDGAHQIWLKLDIYVAGLGAIFAVYAAVCLWRWRPPTPILVYTAVALGMALGSHTIGARPRMLLAAFPAVMAPAYRAGQMRFALLVAASASLMILLEVLALCWGHPIP